MGLFPLNLVAFPGEELNLHIFEPRYKQLINDCLDQKTTFGIPSFVNSKIELGTEVKIQEVTKVYTDGRMDIKTRGLRPIKVLDFQNPWQDRLYAGGVVELLENDTREDPELKTRMLDLLGQLFEWLQMEEQIEISSETTVYTIAHKIGLRPEEEYVLLQTDNESERQQLVIQHLKKILPALERAEEAKERIRMNGHFKHLDPLKF